MTGYLGGDPAGVAAIGLFVVVWVLVADVSITSFGVGTYPAQAIGAVVGVIIAWSAWRLVLRKHSRLARQPKS